MVELLDMIQNILPLIIPLVLIDLVFKVYAIVDIVNEDRKVKGGNKIVWILVSVLVNYGWVIYFIFGKDE
ncbi:MAG: PLDc N-terminal domain-containing protein [Candidatus Izimaplasma sp.]|nr:PLDc N-terminal domain-containing protein [Candidatus Izimaplasma bacterium]